MFSFLTFKKSESPQHFDAPTYGYVVLDADEAILKANSFFISILRSVLDKNVNERNVVGQKLQDVLGKDYKETLIGISVSGDKEIAGKFLIGGQFYQVAIHATKYNDRTYYEGFYIPISGQEETSSDGLFQTLAYKAAESKEYNNIDWIRTISDPHAQQLLLCIRDNKHMVIPSKYCPFRQKCGFHMTYGWEQLDRRLFYRAKADMSGTIYITTINRNGVPTEVSGRPIKCKALDLSLGGVRLQIDAPIRLPVGSTLKLVFPDFTCKGCVKWSKKEGDHWLSGVKFASLDEDQRNKIITIISKNRRILE